VKDNYISEYYELINIGIKFKPCMNNSDSPEFGNSTETGTGYISGVTFGPKKVKFAVINGMAVFEGDIILGTVEELRANTRAVEEGAVITGQQLHWPSGLIPFDIDPNLPSPERVTNAIWRWVSRTNVRFIKHTNEYNYVVFSNNPEPNTCWSSVGMRGNGRQDISLGENCGESTVIHEIGHTLGLWHEQSREDRDNFVRIHLDRVIPGKEHNFNQHITDGDDIGSYDYCSIMHYSAHEFCVSPCPGPTIEVLQPSLPCGTSIGMGNSLSDGDVAAVNHIYVKVPSVIDANSITARRAIESAGLVANFVGPLTNSEVGRQSPQGGDIVLRGTMVTLIMFRTDL
jgi:hypothetical protein